MDTMTVHDEATVDFGGDADPLGALARLFDAMPAGSFVTIAKRAERGRTFVVVSRHVPGRGCTNGDPFELTTLDGRPIDTRDALVLATMALEQKENRNDHR